MIDLQRTKIKKKLDFKMTTLSVDTYYIRSMAYFIYASFCNAQLMTTTSAISCSLFILMLSYANISFHQFTLLDYVKCNSRNGGQLNNNGCCNKLVSLSLLPQAEIEA